MTVRYTSSQSGHDGAVNAAGQIYREHGKHAWVNPNEEKNKDWCGYFIDVIAVETRSADHAWVIEVETEDSVSESEAKEQWKDYDKVYTGRWYLAVPRASESEANRLIALHNLQHCTVITWERNANGTHTFWGLPGLN
ncbi:hypothetical protein KKH27_12090 [bacterium]|nr:hypothetical protein [bacterium]